MIYQMFQYHFYEEGQALLSQIIKKYMCQHNKKMKIFCIHQQCNHNISYGCGDCMKKWHKLVAGEKIITQQELLSLMKIYQVPIQIKQGRKKMIYKVYQTLNNLKNQMFDKIDNYFTEILSKIKYPFLYHENILDTYRLIRDKNYHKISHNKLVHFYKTSKKTKNQDFLNREVSYYQDYARKTYESIEKLPSQLKKIQDIFQFNLSKQIQNLQSELLHELKEFCKIQKFDESVNKEQNQKEKVQLPPQKSLDSIKSSGNLLQSFLNKKSEDYFTPKKPEKILDASFQKSPSFISNQQHEIKISILSKQSYALQENIGQDELQRQKIDNNIDKIHQISANRSMPLSLLSKPSSTDSQSLLKQYSYNQSNTDSIFIKISQISATNISPNLNEKIPNKYETKSTLRQKNSHSINKKDSTNQRQQNIKHRLEELLKEKDAIKLVENDKISQKSKNQVHEQKYLRQVNQKCQKSSQKLKPELKPSYFLNAQNSKRKNSRHDSELNDSLGKQVFDFSREQKPKIISRSIKKQIPFVQNSISVKTQPVPKKSLKLQQLDSQREKQLQIAAIFIAGINQPQIQNKIYFLQKYLEKYQNNLTAIQYLSLLYLQTSKYKECHTHTSKFLQKLKDHFNQSSKLNLIINKSAALNNLGRYSETIRLLDDYKSSENDKIHKNIADAFYNINVLDQAIYHYEKAIKYNHLFDEAYYNVAVILYRQQSYFNAKMNIQKALRINSTEYNYLELKGHIEQRISMNEKNI